jgi:hypothetical protein
MFSGDKVKKINDNTGDSFLNSNFPQGLMRQGSQKHETKYQYLKPNRSTLAIFS